MSRKIIVDMWKEIDVKNLPCEKYSVVKVGTEVISHDYGEDVKVFIKGEGDFGFVWATDFLSFVFEGEPLWSKLEPDKDFELPEFFTILSNELWSDVNVSMQVITIE